MERKIDYNSSVPASRQVAAWLKEDIDQGVYAPGQRLPSIADHPVAAVAHPLPVINVRGSRVSKDLPSRMLGEFRRRGDAPPAWEDGGASLRLSVAVRRHGSACRARLLVSTRQLPRGGKPQGGPPEAVTRC